MFIILLLIFVIAIPKASNSLKIKYNKKPAPITEKELNRIRIAEEKASKQAEKERQQAQKAKQRKQQAESDIMFYQSQYDILYQLARQIETDIQETEKQIEIDKLTHSYDRAKTKENKLYQLTKKQVAIENQLYIMQNRINKAKHIIKAG